MGKGERGEGSGIECSKGVKEVVHPRRYRVIVFFFLILDPDPDRGARLTGGRARVQPTQPSSLSARGFPQSPLGHRPLIKSVFINIVLSGPERAGEDI